MEKNFRKILFSIPELKILQKSLEEQGYKGGKLHAKITRALEWNLDKKINGREKCLTQEQIEQLKELYGQKQLEVREICDILSISKPTLYKYLKQ